MSAIVARNRVALCARMPVLLKVCFSRRHPPENIARPRTNSRLPMIEPAIDAFTRSTSPALNAKMPMMSSGALPKLALRSPPMTGLVRVARSSVDLPINLASGTMAQRREEKQHDRRHARQRCAYGERDESEKRDEQIVHCVQNITCPASTPNSGAFSRVPPRDRAKLQPTISLPAKNCAISFCAVSAASEPCTEFSLIDLANSLRMVPGAALAGSVAPIRSR